MEFEKLKLELQKYGAEMMPPAPNDLVKTQAALQSFKKIMLPPDLCEFYKNSGAIILGDAEIFGLTPVKFGKGVLRSVAEVNHDFLSATGLGVKTIFGRNGLFLFAVSEDIKCVMLDIYTMRAAKVYDDAVSAIRDCLLVGVL